MLAGLVISAADRTLSFEWFTKGCKTQSSFADGGIDVSIRERPRPITHGVVAATKKLGLD